MQNSFPKTLAIVNAFAFIIMVYINYLSNALPINGKTPGQLSDLYVNYFVPAGFTFAIWGVIYGSLLISIVVQVFALFNTNVGNKISPVIQLIGYDFVISCLINVAWLFSWHYQLVAFSVVLMILFLIVLVKIFVKLKIGTFSHNQSEKWLFHFPIAIYLGWICVALVANVTAFLVNINWSSWFFEPSVWAIIMVVIAFLVLSYLVIFKNTVPTALVGTWAFYGIYAKRLSLVGSDTENLMIAQTCLVCLLLLSAFAVFKLKKWFSY